MRRSGKISEEFDRLLAGRALPAENSLGDVEKLVRSLKEAYSAVPEPEVQASHLAAIMDQVQSGLRNGESLAPPPEHIAAQSRWKKAMLRGASASLAVKIIGGAVALAGTTGGLAAFEALPEPAQAPVATAVEVVTPFDLPGNEEEKKAGDKGKLEIEEVPPANLPPEPNPNASFGQNVAEDAREGGVSGQQTSNEARERAEKRREEGRAHRPDEVPPAGPAEIPKAPPSAGPPAGVGSGKGGPQSGLGEAGQKPAGQHIPQSVPAGPPGQTGRQPV